MRGDVTITEHFARSMTIADAMNPENLIVWEMNGEPLPPSHGAPARLIVPGWYGMANVKWLTRIDVTDQRFAGNFMARDYVTMRQITRDGEQVWTLNTVAHDRLKSAPARVIEKDGSFTLQGAAWGEAIGSVAVSVDDEPWQDAQLTTGADDPYTWTFWTYDLGRRPRATIRLRPARLRRLAKSNPRRTIRSWRAKPPTGKATASLPATSLPAERRTPWRGPDHAP